MGVSIKSHFKNSSRFKHSWIRLCLLFSFVILLSFQNCSLSHGPSSSQSDLPSTTLQNQQNSGNGGVYGGLQPPVVPGLVQPGQKVVVAVLGGVGPFMLTSKNNVGQITKIDERRFQWEIPSNTAAQADVLIVRDSLSNEASTKVEIRILTQENNQINFGKTAIQIQNYTLVSMEETLHEQHTPTCFNAGTIKVYDASGTHRSTLLPPPVFCELFAARLSTDNVRVAASGTYQKLTTSNISSSQAGAVIYRLSPNSQFIEEQIIISPNQSIWGWADVEIHGNVFFLHYHARSTNRAMTEVYNLRPDGQWTLAQTIDYSQYTNFLVPSIVGSSDRKSFVFDKSSNRFVLQAADSTTYEAIFLIFEENQNHEWVLVDRVQPTQLLPQELLNLGRRPNITSFQLQGDQFVITANFWDEPARLHHARILIFKKAASGWRLQQTILPPDADILTNYFHMSNIAGEYIVAHHPMLSILAVYKRQGDIYEPYVDLSLVTQSLGFSRNFQVFENKIIVLYYYRAWIFSLF